MLGIVGLIIVCRRNNYFVIFRAHPNSPYSCLGGCVSLCRLEMWHFNCSQKTSLCQFCCDLGLCHHTLVGFVVDMPQEPLPASEFHNKCSLPSEWSKNPYYGGLDLLVGPIGSRPVEMLYSASVHAREPGRVVQVSPFTRDVSSLWLVA